MAFDPDEVHEITIKMSATGAKVKTEEKDVVFNMDTVEESP